PYLCGSGCPWPGLARQRTRVRRPLEALHHHSPRTVDPHRAHPGSGRTPCTGVRPRLTPSAATTPTTPWTLFVNTPLRDDARRPRVNDFTLPVLGVDYIGPTVAAVRAARGELSRSAYVRRAAGGVCSLPSTVPVAPGSPPP